MATNSALMKKNNRLLVLRRIREGTISRAELARQTGLTRASVTLIIEELIRDGLVIEGAASKTASGRRPTMLGLCGTAYYAVGLDICRDGVNLCITDFMMHAVLRDFIPNTVGVEETLNRIERSIRQAQKRWVLLGIGVSAPGPIDIPHRRILNPSNMQAWHGFSVDEIANRLGLPICFEKDTNALAIAEKSYGKQNTDFLVLLADHGLGSAVIHRKKLFASANGFGCELGHTCIDRNGPLCYCGRRGCAELYVSIPAVLKRARKSEACTTWEDLLNKASRGNELCIKLLSEQADALAAVCVDAINLFEPSQIILEGQLSAAHSFLAPMIEKKIGEQAFTETGRHVRVFRSSLPENARAIAAASLILENYFTGEL